MEMVVGRQISRYNRNDITTARYIMDAILSLANNAPAQYKDELLSFAKTQAKLGIEYDPSIYYGGRLSFNSLITLKKLLADDSIPEYSKEYVKIFGQMDKATVQNPQFGWELVCIPAVQQMPSVVIAKTTKVGIRPMELCSCIMVTKHNMPTSSGPQWT